MLLIIILSAVIICIIGYMAVDIKNGKLFVSKEDKKSKEAIAKKVEDYIRTPNRFSDLLEHLSSYDLFKEDCIERVFNGMRDEFVKDNDAYLGFHIEASEFSELLVKELKSNNTDANLSLIFIEQMTKNILEAKKIEEEAIEYHKKFGQEPDGDPVLHPVEAKYEEYGTDNMEEKPIEELSSTGTVEDIED